jgi:hypothetical protein
LIIFATVAQALSSDSPAMSIVGTIIFWRVLMGGKLFDRCNTVKAILTSIQLVSEATTHSAPSSPLNLPQPSGAVP